jgi:hypothetical protein
MRCAARSIAQVLPTPAAMPKKMLKRPRCLLSALFISRKQQIGIWAIFT